MTLVSAVILAYQDDPWLERSVGAVLDSEHVDVEVILVDNGCSTSLIDRLATRSGVTLVRPGRNLGFSGGCNAGAERARGEVVALVNGDAVVAPDALYRLAQVAVQPDVGIASASIRLAQNADLLNSGGNEVHFLGFVWSGAFEQEAAAWPDQRDVAAASGAGMAMRREVWEGLGGFDPEYFAYYEDAELSLRCWQQGLRVVYVPEAVVIHRYEFSRNRQKRYLLERNRLILVLTLFERRTLVLLGPALVGMEMAVLVLALAGGWAVQKVSGWAWLVRHWRWVLSRRRLLQSERTVGDQALAAMMVARLDAGNYPLPSSVRPLNAVLAAYWAVARRFL